MAIFTAIAAAIGGTLGLAAAGAAAGAIAGGVVAAVKGGNILKGALTGALIGGVAGGLAGATGLLQVTSSGIGLGPTLGGATSYGVMAADAAAAPLWSSQVAGSGATGLVGGAAKGLTATQALGVNMAPKLMDFAAGAAKGYGEADAEAERAKAAKEEREWERANTLADRKAAEVAPPPPDVIPQLTNISPIARSLMGEYRDLSRRNAANVAQPDQFNKPGLVGNARRNMTVNV